MHWTGYEIFSVLSGLVLLAATFAPGLGAKDRGWAVLGGLFFIGYGVYVANQTSGTYEFPVVIFIIPFVAAGYLIYSVARRGTGRAGSGTGEHR
jgi:hypothetical protein